MPTTITGLTMSSTGLTITCPTGITFGYIPYSGVCETVQNFEIRKTISGLTAPGSLYYSGITSNNGVVWVADQSEYIHGNIYWFNPLTATSVSNMNYISVLKASDLYSPYIDQIYKRIYFVGTDKTSNTAITGLVIYDITGNTLTQTVYGSSDR